MFRLKFVAIGYFTVSYLLKKPTLFKGSLFVTVSTYVGLSHDVTTPPSASSLTLNQKNSQQLTNMFMHNDKDMQKYRNSSLSTATTPNNPVCFNYKGLLLCICGPRSVVGVATELRAGRSGDRITVGGEIFRTCPDRPWGPPSLLYNGYRVFPGVKRGRGVSLTPHPLLMPWS